MATFRLTDAKVGKEIGLDFSGIIRLVIDDLDMITRDEVEDGRARPMLSDDDQQFLGELKAFFHDDWLQPLDEAIAEGQRWMATAPSLGVWATKNLLKPGGLGKLQDKIGAYLHALDILRAKHHHMYECLERADELLMDRRLPHLLKSIYTTRSRTVVSRGPQASPLPEHRKSTAAIMHSCIGENGCFAKMLYAFAQAHAWIPGTVADFKSLDRGSESLEQDARALLRQVGEALELEARLHSEI